MHVTGDSRDEFDDPLLFEGFPDFKPLLEMVNNLAKIGCPGAAWTIGPALPPEVVTRWPYFARIFEAAKGGSSLIQWPDS